MSLKRKLTWANLESETINYMKYLKYNNEEIGNEMNIKDSMYSGIEILKRLMDGKTLQLDDITIAMGEDGRVGQTYKKGDKLIVVGDLTIKEFFDLIKKHEIVPIPNLR